MSDIVSKPPWPLRSRDVIAYVELIIEPATDQIKMRLQGANNHLKPKGKHIRLPKFEAEWSIFPFEDNKSRVRYQLYTEPGGEVLRWFFNSVAMDIPLYSMINLRQHFSKPLESKR